MSYKVTFEFPTQDARTMFIGWMCDCGGEQGFMDCCDVNYYPSPSFDYWSGTNDGKYYVGGSKEKKVTIKVEMRPTELSKKYGPG